MYEMGHDVASKQHILRNEKHVATTDISIKDFIIDGHFPAKDIVVFDESEALQKCTQTRKQTG